MGISSYCFSFVLSLQTSNTVSNCTFGGPVTYHDINTVPGLSLHVESHCLHTNEGTSQQIYSFFADADVSHSQTCYYPAINTSIVLNMSWGYVIINNWYGIKHSKFGYKSSVSTSFQWSFAV